MPRARSGAWQRAGFFAIVVLVLAFADQGHISGDGEARWRTLVALVEEGRLTADKYSVVQPLLASPLYALGALAGEVGAPADAAARTERRIAAARKAVARYNKLVALGICLVGYWVAARLFAFREWQARGTVFLLLFGTLLLPHARDFYSECTWTLLSLVVLAIASRWLAGAPPRHAGPVLVGALALAVLANPVLAVAFPAALGLALLASPGRTPRAVIVRGGLGVGLGAALVLAENLVRRGAPFRFGYEGAGFTTPLLDGLAGELWSPAKGLLFFLPAFLLGGVLWLRHRAALNAPTRWFLLVSHGYAAGLLLVYAKWWAWHGSWYWGPRFLLPLSVFGALYLALLVRLEWRGAGTTRRALPALLVLYSALVYKVGVGVNQEHLLECVGRGGRDEACYWSFAYTPPASLGSREDLRKMATDRSTAVEGGAAALMALLWAASRRERPGSRDPVEREGGAAP